MPLAASWLIFLPPPWYKKGKKRLNALFHQGEFMKEALISFALVVVIEAISAAVTYLKTRLMANLHRSGDEPWENHPEFV